jgi:hypothetical protein
MDEEKLKEEKTETSEVKKTGSNEIYWIIGVMLGLTLIFVFASMVFQNLRTFEYEELTFTKEKFGDIPVYHYYYFPKNAITGQIIGQYNLYLREDPRKNSVPVDGEIAISQSGLTYISVNATELVECEDSSVAIASLSGFLTDHGIDVKGATPDKELAEANNLTYSTCENRRAQNVIIIKKGEKTMIVNNDNCHVIEVNECEIIKAVEKFEIQMLLDARRRSGL